MRKLSSITDGLVGQPMFKLLTKVKELERAGRTIFHFEIGDSDFRAYDHVLEATKQALDNDRTHYVNSMGIMPFRQAVCDSIEETLGFRPDIDQILVMPANAIVDFVIRCVANPGEEVIFPDPGFPTYMAVTNYTGVNKVGVPLREEHGFHIQMKDIAERITEKTRLMIINSPQNPTGAVLNKKETEDIAHLTEDKDLYLLSDEIYSKIIYSGKHYSPGVLDKCLERTIILNGFAKGYSMPGWRLGYAVGPKNVIKKMGILFETIYSCVPPFIQYAGISALKGNQEIVEERIAKFRVFRDLIVKKMNEIEGVSCNVPEGACYVFPNIKATGMNSTQFANFVLEKAGVALLPGSCFGPRGEGYIRLCFTRKLEVIEQGCERMKEALAEPRIKIASMKNIEQTEKTHQPVIKL